VKNEPTNQRSIQAEGQQADANVFKAMESCGFSQTSLVTSSEQLSKSQEGHRKEDSRGPLYRAET
jgi:hypothetical protein